MRLPAPRTAAPRSFAARLATDGAARAPFVLCSVFVTYFSVQADSISPHSRFYNAADRVCASIGLLICPVRVTLLNECSGEFRAAVWALFLLCFATLTWSRQSANSGQFVFRHSLWHALSIIGLSWLAWRETHGTVTEPVLSRWAGGDL